MTLQSYLKFLKGAYSTKFPLTQQNNPVYARPAVSVIDYAVRPPARLPLPLQFAGEEKKRIHPPVSCSHVRNENMLLLLLLLPMMMIPNAMKFDAVLRS